MSSAQLLRAALRSPSCSLLRSHLPPRRLPIQATRARFARVASNSFSTSARRSSSGYEEETFEEFTARYEKEFDNVHDVFELQRNLNNAFAYDLVPSPSVITAALRAARRVNDFPTAVRIFEAIKEKVENRGQYDEYVEDLKPLREELGILLQEEMYPNPKDLESKIPPRPWNVWPY